MTTRTELKSDCVWVLKSGSGVYIVDTYVFELVLVAMVYSLYVVLDVVSEDLPVMLHRALAAHRPTVIFTH